MVLPDPEELRHRLQAELADLEDNLRRRDSRIARLTADNERDRAEIGRRREFLAYLEATYPIAGDPPGGDSGSPVVEPDDEGQIPCAVAIDRIIRSASAPLSAEEIHRRILGLGSRVTGGSTLIVVRTHLSKGRSAYGWQRTRTRPARWYVERPAEGQEESAA